MSKKIEKTSTHKNKPKKEIDEELMARFQVDPVDANLNSGRKRLKKLCEVNESEEMLDPSGEEDNLLEDPEELPQYQQFGLKDDEQLQRERDAMQNAKKSKKLKGNQQLDKFIEKQTNKDVKQKKEEKSKPKIQMTIAQMMRIKKEKQKIRKVSDDFIVSDHGELSEEIDERQLEIKCLSAYEKYNGSMDDEKKLVEKAMKLSLTASSIQKEEALEDFAYENPKASKPASKSLTTLEKPLTKEKEAIKPQKKETKKSKPAPKQEKTGPLAGFTIVFTGDFDDFSKDDLIEVCEQLGAQCPKSLVKKCNLLLQGSHVRDAFKRKSSQPIEQTAKSKQAKERGIDIITHDKIDGFFLEKTGVTLDHHLSKNKVSSNPIGSFMFKPLDGKGTAEMHPAAEVNKKIINATNINGKKQELMEIESGWAPNPIKDLRLWTDKYKPTKLEEVIGQSSQIKSLREWLECWEDIHIRGNKREVKETKGWNAAGSINSFAALLSGDPGIGKTTTARLLAMEYNYSVTEFNASDVRNKSGVNLMETGSYNLDMTKNLNKSLIIMDEVDGMSSGDRGGVAAIINMIKSSKVPIICICNDRQSEKIRSLAGHCLDVKFHKPNKNMMVKRLREILMQEGGSGEERALEQLVQTFQNDMRQILSYLEVIFKTVSHKITLDALSSKNQSSKDARVMINHFDAARKLLNRTQFSRMRIGQRTDCFFVDSNMVPLMVHENLLSSARKAPPSVKEFHSLVQGVEGFVIGDLLDRSIRKEQEWGLMPSYGFMSCVYATQKISESVGFPQFPSWLGKFSSERKMKRLSKEFKDAIFPETLNGSWKSAKSLYVPMITHELSELLKKQSVQEAVMLMQQYNLTPAMINEHLASLYYNDKVNPSNPLSDIPSNVKGKLTRLFNKRHEDAKMKQSTKPKSKIQAVKFDPEMQQVQQQYSQEQSQEQKSEIVVSKPKAKKAKK